MVYGYVDIYIGVGSNLGDRRENILNGLNFINCHVTLTKISSIYESPPWGYKAQPPFLNCVCRGVTSMTPKSVLDLLKDAEKYLGRKPNIRWGPRVFDADILFYGQLMMNESYLEIPHPRVPERAFVLVPLLEIAPNFIHPSNGRSVQDMMSTVTGIEELEKWGCVSPCEISNKWARSTYDQEQAIVDSSAEENMTFL